MKNKYFGRLSTFVLLITGLLLYAFPALAESMVGQPHDWGIMLQEAGSPVKERMEEFHDLLLIIISIISFFVLALLVYVVLRFNSRMNPKPSSVSHNVMLEIAWTIVPVIILIIIAIPSFKLLYYGDRTPGEPDMTLEVTGYQWYWGYRYPDYEGISFNAYMVPDDEIDTSKGQVRLLSTDNPVVLPINKDIQILTFGGDVLHSFAVPALGVKQDTVPGRMNETWVRITKPGVYYGQCSELCGKDHSYMPIEIHAVTQEEFDAWVESAKEEYAAYTPHPETPVQDSKPVQLATIEE